MLSLAWRKPFHGISFSTLSWRPPGATAVGITLCFSPGHKSTSPISSAPVIPSFCQLRVAPSSAFVVNHRCCSWLLWRFVRPRIGNHPPALRPSSPQSDFFFPPEPGPTFLRTDTSTPSLVYTVSHFSPPLSLSEALPPKFKRVDNLFFLPTRGTTMARHGTFHSPSLEDGRLVLWPEYQCKVWTTLLESQSQQPFLPLSATSVSPSAASIGNSFC